MSPTAADWDARIDRLTGRLPRGMRNAVAWLKVPSRRPVLVAAAVALIAGGVLSSLIILGIWMLPLGFALLGEDIPALYAPSVKIYFVLISLSKSPEIARIGLGSRAPPKAYDQPRRFLAAAHRHT